MEKRSDFFFEFICWRKNLTYEFSLLSAGLALLIAQGTVNKGETDKLNGENKSGPESDDQLQSHDEVDSIKDLDCSSGPEHHEVYTSEPETRL